MNFPAINSVQHPEVMFMHIESLETVFCYANQSILLLSMGIKRDHALEGVSVRKRS